MDWLYFILGFTLGIGLTILAIALLAMFASVSKLEEDIKDKQPIKKRIIMPNPKANETKDDFMNRCIPQLIKEGKEQDQAVAICSNMYDEQKMSKKDKMFKRLFKK